MRDPGNLQLVDVLFVDLVEGGETVAVGGVTPVRPVFLLFARRDGFDRYRFVALTSGADLNIQPKLTASATASTAATPNAGPFFAGGLARKGQTRAARKASTPSANRREKSGQ
jgi:hypothetical protein